MAIDWAKKLEEAGDKRASKPKGKDWFTVHELRQNTGYSVTILTPMFDQMARREDGKI